jgi:hypothetical protein
MRLLNFLIIFINAIVMAAYLNICIGNHFQQQTPFNTCESAKKKKKKKKKNLWLFFLII